MLLHLSEDAATTVLHTGPILEESRMEIGIQRASQSLFILRGEGGVPLSHRLLTVEAPDIPHGTTQYAVHAATTTDVGCWKGLLRTPVKEKGALVGF